MTAPLPPIAASEQGFARSLTWRYLIALALVATLSTAAWISLRLVISDQEGTAAVVNVSGRQRMLSQRTALLANLLVAAPQEQRAKIRAELEKGIDLLERSHIGLIRGNAQMGLPDRMSSAVHAMYFDGPAPLDAQVQAYVRAVRSLLALSDAELSADAVSLQQITGTALGPLVEALNAMVLQYQHEGESTVKTLEMAETAFWLTTLVLLALEAGLIFQPFIRHTRSAMARLQQLTTELQQHRDTLESTVQERTSALELQRQALAQSEEKFRLISTAAHDAIVIVGAGRRVVYWNPAAEAMFGFASDEVMGRSLGDFLDAPELLEVAGRSFKAMQSSAQAALQGQTLELSARRKNGEEFAVELSLAGVRYRDEWHAVCIARDVSTRRAAEQDMRIAATAFESQEGMMVTDHQARVLRVNRAFTRITGYHSDDIRGKSPAVLSSGRQNADFYTAMWAELRSKGSWEGEIWNRRKNGEIYPEYLTITAVKDAQDVVRNYVATFSDITLSKAAADQIENLAFYDPLTLLPNRRLLRDRLHQALAFCARNAHFGALLFIDLDNFKTLNDTQGHDKGDLLLQQVAQRLLLCVRKRDTVSRLGGDEFVVVLEDLSTVALEAAAQAEVIASKILETLGQSYDLDGITHRNTPSIGVVLFDGRAEGIDELLKQADIAMYQAKSAGRNAIRFFDAGMQAGLNERVEMERDLRLGLEGAQFRLHLQIQMDSQGRVLGAEGLVRWQHPARGLVAPGLFIQLAEETGLILPLGKWVLETACAQLRAWQSVPEFAHLHLAVNVSAKQFRQADFVSEVLAVLQRYGVEPSHLKLELTESMLLQDISSTIEKMHALKACGVRFSLDDFGTGYSSLQYLKRLPLDQLKIDQSFVQDLASDGSDEAIVTAIVDMARSLRLNVIAEGVETDEQRQRLLARGCLQYQGYLFGRPVPAPDFEALARKCMADAGS